jgi:predicted transglutaminase-like cysteine proteinase
MKGFIKKSLRWCFKLSVITILFFSKYSMAHKVDFLLSQANQKINGQHDRKTRQRMSAWERLVFHNQDKSVEEKLKLVNDFFNQMRWVEDKKLWKEKDYWATPMESLIKNAGDCEDFSIAKYYTLLAMDLSEKQLKITYVKLNEHRGHMVLFFYPSYTSEPLVLDNIIKDIKKRSERNDIKYVFSFNDEGFWLDSKKNSKPSDKNIIKQWANMIDRINKE